MDNEDDRLIERTFTAEERRKLASEGKARPDGSYTIENEEDLHNAIRAWGRGGATSADKAHIKKRAKELGAEGSLPDDWKEVSGSGEPERFVVDGRLAVQLLEVDASGSECEFMLIETGTSKNGFHYPSNVLKEATQLFNGVYAFADHTNDDEQRVRPERSVKDKVGRWSEAHYGVATIGGQQVEGVIGKLKVIAPWLRDLLRESVKMGESDFVGVSIDAAGKTKPGAIGGRRVKEVEKILKVHSVDVVTTPSAGGRLMRLVASDSERRTVLDPETTGDSQSNVNGSGGVAIAESNGNTITMTKEQLAQTVREAVASLMQEVASPLTAAIKQQNEQVTRINEAQRLMNQESKINAALSAANGLSEMGKKQLQMRFMETARNRDLDDAEVVASIRESLQYEAKLLEHYQGQMGPRSTPRATVGQTEYDQHYQALIGMFENRDQVVNNTVIPRYRSIREAYCRWTGRDNFEVDAMEIQRAFAVNYDSAFDHKRIQESVSTATWGQVYADVLYLMLIKAYRVNPVYNKWRAVVSDIENVPDFQTRHWTRLGGYSDLGTVVEQGTYPMLTSSTNEQVTYSVAKRGGLDDVTFEAIANDRVGAIRRIPIAMARTAARTLFKFVMNLITTTNPTMGYDSAALYSFSSHANVGVAGSGSNQTFSLTGVQQAILNMRAQTAFSETSEILGERNKPKIFIVPTILELVAQRILQPSDSYLAAIANPSTEQSLDPQAFKGMNMDYIVYDVLTSTTGWYAVADPAEVATFVIGFLNGKEDPELFVQDQPNVGANFTADKVTYKVRHIYGGVVEDHRSFYQGST